MGRFRSAYDGLGDEVSASLGLSFEGPGRTQQQFKDETDINTIARKFGLTGMLPAPRRLPSFGDFTGISDYQTALNQVMAADAAFLTLPAPVRDRFGNDYQALLDFLADEGNRQEATDLGLLERLEPEVVPPTPPA